MTRRRIGASTWVLEYPFDPTHGPELIAKMAVLGCSHVELGGEAAGTAAPSLNAVRRQLERDSLTSSVCGLFSAERDMSSTDASIRAAAHAHLLSCFELADAIGAYIVVGALCGTGGRELLSDATRAARLEIARSEIARASVTAERYGLTLGFEPLNRYENNLINTVDDVLSVVEALDSTNVGVHLDVFHGNIEEISLPMAIRNAGSRLKHLHVVSNQRGAPGDSGYLPWTDIVEALDAVVYDGAMVVEAVIPYTDLAEAACVWRPVKGSQEALIADAMSFLDSLQAV